jgi:hypothetical protein
MRPRLRRRRRMFGRQGRRRRGQGVWLVALVAAAAVLLAIARADGQPVTSMELAPPRAELVVADGPQVLCAHLRRHTPLVVPSIVAASCSSWPGRCPGNVSCARGGPE